MNEFERLRMKDTDSIDIFSGKILELASKSAALGQAMAEPKLVKKFLDSLPQSKYIQIIASLEQVLDLNKTISEDFVGRLKAYEERIQEEDTQEPQGKLLYTDSNQSYNSRGRGRGWNRGRGNIGRGRGRSNTQERGKGKKDYSQIACYSCKKKSHFGSDFPEMEQDYQELNKADT